MLSSDKSNIFVSMKVHLASVYEKILSSVGVNLSSSKVNSSGSKVTLSGGEVGSSGSKVNLSKILILKSIVCGMCVMFSSDVSWGMNGDDNEINDKIPTYKVVLLGNSQVGKTQIVNKKQTGIFEAKSLATVGVSLTSFNVKIKQDNFDQNIKLKVFDTAGQEKYRGLISDYFKIGNAFVIVYDITNKESFNNIPTWIQLAKDNATQNPVYFLVGNKTDMENDGKRNVRTDDAEKFAIDNKMQFFEVSALYGTNIDDLFEAIANACFNNDTIKKIKNEYIEDTKNEDPIKNKNHTLKDSKEPEKNDIQIHTHSKNKRCNCCPCCNKDEEDQKEETKSHETTSNILTDNTSLN